ncbi:MAG: hypothetical protein H6728_11625 [Myxococcales bacterium]|nr:hypothetical protein [Myxococcales bacterium]
MKRVFWQGFLCFGWALLCPNLSDARSLPMIQGDAGVRVSCGKRAIFRTIAVPSAAPAVLQIVNKSFLDIDLYWFSYQGKLQKYATIKSRRSYRQATFVGHAWMAKIDLKDRPGCVALYRPRRSAAYVVEINDADVGVPLHAQRYAQKAPSKGHASVRALQAKLSREWKKRVFLKVQSVKVSGVWAFLSVRPTSRRGGKFDYRGTPYWQQVKEGQSEDTVYALAKKAGRRWRVVTYLFGCTDVCWMGWDKQYGAPKSVFP